MPLNSALEAPNLVPTKDLLLKHDYRRQGKLQISVPCRGRTHPDIQ